ncbi:hypothetical protein C3B44_00275 [Corynebacterium yudongzhengii]|uniref:MFS transporter n=1 Tax=Corynebacterium yudongzhengii TaxID=2080740 RepID=A0A2U1T4I5_9CORY|nr:MFS transporter [Corynebacterium yudongzhengii]AWB80976.1 hypothetical protein C3B44_00275 [Corynebacterium yudongzhengii]PWC00911.1 MFS transporter [Corynebacterium yudongzhengii]
METSRRAERLSTTTAILAVFTSQLPITVVAVSLSEIADDTGTPIAGLQWMQSLYLLAMAAAVLSAGVIAETVGRKRVIVSALLLMVVGATVGAVASISAGGVMPLLLTAQATAGVGAGALLPTTLATINTTVTDPARRARAVAGWVGGTTGGLAGGVLAGGVLAGGVISQWLSWGWVYVLVAALAAAVAGFAAFALRRAPTSDPGLDVVGQATATLGIVALIFGFIRGGSAGFLSAPALLAYLVAAAAFVVCALHERRTRRPLIPPSMFRAPLFNAAALAAAMALFTVIGTGFLLVVFLGQGLDHDPWRIALHMVFMPGTALVAAFTVTGFLMSRLDAAHVLLCGIISAGLGTFALSQLPGDFTLIDVAWRLAFIGLGVALMISLAAAVAVHSCAPDLAPKAGAVNTAFRQTGGALAPAFLGSLYAAAAAGGGDALNAFTGAVGVIAWLLLGTGLLVMGAIALDRAR